MTRLRLAISFKKPVKIHGLENRLSISYNYASIISEYTSINL